MSANFKKYYSLYQEALSFAAERDEAIKRRNEVYYGTAQPLDFSNPAIKYSKKKLTTFRKMAYELIESQIDTSIPLPKITARYAEDSLLASNLQDYLELEADFLNSEEVNDVAEREVRVQGTGIYHILWDETLGNTRHRGGLKLQFVHLINFYPQPQITDPKDLEYVFIHSTTTVRKVKQLYGKDVEPSDGTQNTVNIVICWYLNDNNEVCKLIWKKESLDVLYDMENYFARKVRVCKTCGTHWIPKSKKCAHCGGTTTTTIDRDSLELPEDLKILDTKDENAEPKVYIEKGTQVPLYRITSLPFVIRKNVPRVEASLYGVSDVDLIEEAQDANNKVLQKIAENIMNGGTLITLPSNTTIDNAAGSIKKVRIQDPRQKQLVSVAPVQANVQQDDIFQDRLYQIGRQGIGITDAYQGKRDPTAESGRAKEVSAAQTAGRLESKFVTKTTAYAHLYQKMFEFLLAFSNERRRIVKPYQSEDKIEEVPFNKYSFLLKEEEAIFYNDDFIFATNGSYVLSNKKESLWDATTAAFSNGAFGNPQEPRTIKLYWQLMTRYNYPLGSVVLALIENNEQKLPPELEAALLANPELLNELIALIQAKGMAQEAQHERSTQEALQMIDPTMGEIEEDEK